MNGVNTIETHRPNGHMVKQSYDGTAGKQNMFPSIEAKKKFTSGNSKHIIKSPGLVRSNFYNPNKITHYKQDYLKMMQKEAEKKMTDVFRQSSPLRNISQQPMDFIKPTNPNDMKNINDAINNQA